jgi:hypothetical protein
MTSGIDALPETNDDGYPSTHSHLPQTALDSGADTILRGDVLYKRREVCAGFKVKASKVFIAGLALTVALTVALAAGSARADWRDEVPEVLRSAYRWAMLPEMDNTITHATPWPGEDPLTSAVTIDAKGPVTVGSYATIRVVYTAGAGGLHQGGGIRVAFEHGADWGQLQYNKNRRENYATVKGPPGVTWKLSANYNLGVCSMFEAVVADGEVSPGSTVRIMLGDRSGGGPGLRAPSMSDVPGAGRLRVFEDRRGRGNYYQMPDPPEVKVVPDQPDHLRVIARAWAQVGKPVRAVIHVDDRFNNVVGTYRGWFAVKDAASGQLLGEVRLAGDKVGVGVVEDVKCRKEGVLRLRVEAVGGNFAATSNPILCTAEPNAAGTYFGSIHNHTLTSDGLNTMEGAAAYARDVSNLDFFALTEHSIWPDWDFDHVLLRHVADKTSWDREAKVTRDCNRPGEFVTVLGFEWTTNTYGDKNIYFFDDQAPFRVFPPDPQSLYKSLANERVTIVTHTMFGVSGVRGPRWDLVDSQFERVMEIASFHGVREYAGNVYPICESDAIIPTFLVRGNWADSVLASGLHLGFVAGPDDHSGKPGAGIPGILRCPADGLTGVRGPRLDRETVFHALEQRATFATTGARVLLDFTINGQGMGGTVKAGAAPRAIKATVYGEAPVAEVAVIKGNPRQPAHTFTFNPPTLDPGELAWTDSDELGSPAFYYLRVIQVDHHLAWSSPIWVE